MLFVVLVLMFTFPTVFANASRGVTPGDCVLQNPSAPSFTEKTCAFVSLSALGVYAVRTFNALTIWTIQGPGVYMTQIAPGPNAHGTVALVQRATYTTRIWGPGSLSIFSETSTSNRPTMFGDPEGVVQVGTAGSDNPNGDVAVGNGGQTFGSLVAVNTTGQSTGVIAVSGTGCASGVYSAQCGDFPSGGLAVSGTGNATSSLVAVSGTGNTQGGAVQVSGMGILSGDAPPTHPDPVPQVGIWHPLPLAVEAVEPGVVIVASYSCFEPINGSKPLPTCDPGTEGAEGGSSVSESVDAAPRRIECDIRNAAWRFISAWQVETILGPVYCSEPIKHYMQSKTVKRCWWHWCDQSVTTTTRGPTYTATIFRATHTIRGSGTYHVHLRDLAETTDGLRQYILWGDGQNFTCQSGRGCRL